MKKHSKSRNYPIKIIKMSSIQVVWEPTILAFPGSSFFDKRDDKNCSRSFDTSLAEEQNKTHTFQLYWHLIIEELLQTD